MGIYSNQKLSKTLRIVTNPKESETNYYNIIYEYIDSFPVNLIIIASVVPAISDIFRNIFSNNIKIPHFFVTANTPLGIVYPVEDPSFIGADLVVNVYSAWKKYNKNCIIIDLGTATTVQLIDINGKYYGASILPGVLSATNGLINNAAKLSGINIENTDILLGKNTKEALLSGCVIGHAFAIEGYIKRIKEDYSNLENIITIATGGFANLISRQTNMIDILDETLTLDGLYLIGSI